MKALITLVTSSLIFFGYVVTMDISNLNETDLFGRFFLKTPNGGKFHNYYSSLDAIRPLIRGDQWAQYVTGYYINITRDFEAVRLSYWTTSPEHTKKVVNQFVENQGLHHAQNPTIPSRTRNSDGYGGEEMRFRRFLAIYTQIGLDIMERDLLNARCLFATFRWQVMRAGRSYKPHFLKTFQNHSAFFNSLTSNEKKQFWLDLANWPDPDQVDWAHMFVNMVLGGDWFPIWDNFRSPQRPLSISEINDLLRVRGFQIPENWSP